jgi:hypothetical protein
MTEFKQALARVLESAEKECWDLYNTPITDEAQKQRVIGNLEGIEKILGFLDDELAILAMEENT